MAGRWDFEIVALDRFHVLPEPGGLYDQDPGFVDELLIFIQADADHQAEHMKKLKK